MIELVLVRHAKSDWADPSLRDHDRPLNDRGRQNAPMMAARLAATGFRPELILSSTAVRARDTAEVFAAKLGAEVTLRPELYLSSARTLLGVAAASGAKRVMLFAHDPGITELAYDLSDGGMAHMPTCAVAHFTWNTDDWDVATSVPPDTWDQQTPR